MDALTRTHLSKAISLASGTPALPSAGEALEHLGRFRCNNFEIALPDDLAPVGEATLPLASLFNHSCWPNCVAIFDYPPLDLASAAGLGCLPPCVSIRTIRAVAPGEELCIAYMDAIHHREHRRSLLSSKYSFWCECPRCQAEKREPLVNGFSARDMPLSASEAESFGWSVFQWFKGHLSTACDEYDEMRRNMLAGTDKDPRGREEMAAYTSIAALQHSSRHFGDALDSQSWRPAARFGMHVLGVYLLVYPRFQPIASVHALQVAKALWNAGRAELASELLEIVVTSVRISHGETAGSGMLRESKALLEMAGEELGG